MNSMNSCVVEDRYLLRAIGRNIGQKNLGGPGGAECIAVLLCYARLQAAKPIALKARLIMLPNGLQPCNIARHGKAGARNDRDGNIDGLINRKAYECPAKDTCRYPLRGYQAQTPGQARYCPAPAPSPV